MKIWNRLLHAVRVTDRRQIDVAKLIGAVLQLLVTRKPHGSESSLLRNKALALIECLNSILSLVEAWREIMCILSRTKACITFFCLPYFKCAVYIKTIALNLHKLRNTTEYSISYNIISRPHKIRLHFSLPCFNWDTWISGRKRLTVWIFFCEITTEIKVLLPSNHQYLWKTGLMSMQHTHWEQIVRKLCNGIKKSKD
jgi:hypothetical protein